MSKVTAINIIIKKKNLLRKYKEGCVSSISIDDILLYRHLQKEKVLKPKQVQAGLA